MEVKETVMSWERMRMLMSDNNKHNRGGEERVEKYCEAQAEITWPIAYKAGRQEVVELVRDRLNTITCMDNYADQDKAITSLIYELKEWGIKPKPSNVVGAGLDG